LCPKNSYEVRKVLRPPTDNDLMRRVALLAIALLLGAWLIALGGDRVTADTPVTVVVAGDPVLLLPISPGVDRVVADLRAELIRLAAETTDPRITDAFTQIASDDELLRQIADSPVEMFDSGRAAATATAVYDVSLEPEGVTVVVATVELVPGYGATAISRDHEDGHALINRRVAARCAKEVVMAAVGEGHQDDALIVEVISRLSAASEPVHHLYHQYVENAGLGAHLRQAERALGDAPGC
jgi:hypothetical protein